MGPHIAKTEVYVKGKWKLKDFTLLKKGDIYRCYLPDGVTLSKDPQGETVHRATSDAKADSTGFHWTVDSSSEHIDLKKL